ncbi:DUF6172 family protein [Halarcobacter ebronensis]|uniref:DUF6172 family protein n=1 Tax=Halarcobacter ebronensis TaxID=1462615 RepID=UPI003C762FD6
MKKTFKLKQENKHPDRVVDSIKYEVRKYIKREKRKTLPEDKDFWFFDCKFAIGDDEPKEIEFADITKSIDEAAKSEADTFYLEILARAEKRPEKEEKTEEVESEDEDKVKD